jgi:hypothetical protein
MWKPERGWIIVVSCKGRLGGQARVTNVGGTWKDLTDNAAKNGDVSCTWSMQTIRERQLGTQNFGTIVSKWNKPQTSGDRDTRVPCHDGAIALYCLQVLMRPELRKFPKVRRIRRICDVSVIVKVNITLVVVVSCTKRQGEMINVVDCLIDGGGEFFEDTLDVVPVKHANRWEGE